LKVYTFTANTILEKLKAKAIISDSKTDSPANASKPLKLRTNNKVLNTMIVINI